MTRAPAAADHEHPLRRARRKRGLTLTALAGLAGLSDVVPVHGGDRSAATAPARSCQRAGRCAAGGAGRDRAEP